MAKETPEHKDLLGNLITAESKLAVARGNSLRVCSVVDIHPKMLRVKPIYGHYRGEGHLVFSGILSTNGDYLLFKLFFQ